MLMKKRITWLGLITLVASLLLAACTLGQQPEPTPEAVDVEAIYTSAAETAMVQMTEIASLATPTLPPTATFTPAPTEAVQEENTPLVQVTPLSDAAPTADPAAPGIVQATPTPIVAVVPTLAVPGVVGTPDPECNSAAWEGETIPDGTKIKAGEYFTKVWKLRNTGTCTWTDAYSFRLIQGERMGGVDYFFIGKNNHIPPGEAVSMGVAMRAPATPGRYTGYWQLFSDQATNTMAFGWPVYVEIEVVK
jgi:hypothetical protein